MRVVSKDEAKSNSASSAQFGRSSSIAQFRDARCVVQLLHSINTINAGGGPAPSTRAAGRRHIEAAHHT